MRLGISCTASCPYDHAEDKTEHGYHVASAAWAGLHCLLSKDESRDGNDDDQEGSKGKGRERGALSALQAFQLSLRSAHRSLSLIVLSLRMP
jgi:hypothetical protein